jgi:hypothetical protein
MSDAIESMVSELTSSSRREEPSGSRDHDGSDFFGVLDGTVSEDATTDDALPLDLANEVEEYEALMAERYGHESDDGQKPVQAPAQQQAQQPDPQAAELERLRQENAVRQQQIALAQQRLAAQQQAQQQQALIDSIPDKDLDPIGHMEALVAIQNAQIQDMQRQEAMKQQVAQAQQEMARDAADLTAFAEPLEQEFQIEHPDYPEAFDYLTRALAEKLQQTHPHSTPQEIQAVQKLATRQFLQDCKANGTNPSAKVYSTAQELGYLPGRKEVAKRVPNKAPAKAVTVDDITGMSSSEFDDFFNKLKGSGRGDLTGSNFGL